eukprot:m.160089 g.160089  ORF g.160089 m.160089 type:complete len:815 (+) comp11898_c0_seq1:573-3017(+)
MDDDFWAVHGPLTVSPQEGGERTKEDTDTITTTIVAAKHASLESTTPILPELSEAVEDSDVDTSRVTHADRDTESDAGHSGRPVIAHHSSETSLADRFVQIDLNDETDDYDLQRARGSPNLPELFASTIERKPGPVNLNTHTHTHRRSASDTTMPHRTPCVNVNTGRKTTTTHGEGSPPVSFLANNVNTPWFFRRDDDVRFPVSESEGDSTCDTFDDDDDADETTDSGTPTPAPVMGGYDSAAESDETTTTTVGTRGDDNCRRADDEDEGLLGSGGIFGRIAWVFKRTRDDLTDMLGACTGPTTPGCSAALSAATAGPNIDIAFEEIQEIKFLGSGASGCVFLGMYNNEKVAVKKFRNVDDTQIESKLLTRMSHPNIVRFLGVCNQPPVHCIVMEYCPKNLYEVIKHSRIPPTQICEWARQIAAGMEYLHEENHVHRDLKSPNVLLAQDRRTLRISDFGTARKVGSRTLSEKTMCGSPPWMAPELIRNEPYGKTVDVWSYGVVLWELLTGEVPYRGVEQGAIIFGVAMKSLHLPVPTTAPLGFSLLLKQCWNTEPKHRPAFRQILLHLDILLEDSGFAEVPVEAYYATQLKWKEEMKHAFEKMKQEEMEKRKTDQELLQRREEELAHARDIRQLYEARLQTVSQLLVELREREHELGAGSKKISKRRQRSRGLLTSGSRGLAKSLAGRRRSKEVRRRSSDASSSSSPAVTKKFSSGSLGSSPGLSPLAMRAVTRRDHISVSEDSPSTASSSMLSGPVFPPVVRTSSGGSARGRTSLGTSVSFATPASHGTAPRKSSLVGGVGGGQGSTPLARDA